VIAVTGRQATALRRAAEKRAKGRGTKGNVAAYFQLVEGAVPKKTNSGSSCARHRLVRVVRGLRKAANINHKAMGRVVFAPGTRLARKHPRGAACYMMPSAPDPMERARSSGSLARRGQSMLHPNIRAIAMTGATPASALLELSTNADDTIRMPLLQQSRRDRLINTLHEAQAYLTDLEAGFEDHPNVAIEGSPNVDRAIAMGHNRTEVGGRTMWLPDLEHEEYMDAVNYANIAIGEWQSETAAEIRAVGIEYDDL
jgi:hypothetical protein